jgi:fatty-acyl-CoA synthase
VPFVEIRARGDEGLVPWDGKSMGELEVRGPSIIKTYFNTEEGDDKFSEGGWFKTGDIVTIDRRGFIKITDRSQRPHKIGGRVDLLPGTRNALMAHPAVAEAAVIAMPHEKVGRTPARGDSPQRWRERHRGRPQKHLEKDFAKFWLPDAYEFVEEIPKTATGKFLKMELREQFKDYQPASQS